ncbi:MAG: hypothetical protein ACI379_03395 [Nocardioides sp.]|uniref:hypothetical protein n=1 Tax=Nocardioides sp. TaxID=35761 RepID=UPI003F11F000
MKRTLWTALACAAAVGLFLLLRPPGVTGAAPLPDDAGEWLRPGSDVPAGGAEVTGASTLRVGDTVVELGAEVLDVVAAGGGAYLVGESSGDSGSRVWFVSEDGDLVDTGLRARPGSLAVSPNGRYVGVLDPVASGRDGGTATVVTTRVLDTVEGEQVVDTVRGMEGAPWWAAEDLAWKYDEYEIGLELTDSMALVDGLEDFIVSLPDGDITMVEDLGDVDRGE